MRRALPFVVWTRVRGLRLPCRGSKEGLNGLTRQLFVPREWELRVRWWVEDYRRARELMEEVSGICRDKVLERGGPVPVAAGRVLRLGD
jgi:hypothetical protein